MSATLLPKQAVRVMFVQESLGYSDVSPTLNNDSHVLPDMSDQASASIEAAST